MRTIAIGFGGIVGAAHAFMLAVSGVTRTSAPEIAARFMPADGLALANRAEQLVLANPQNPPEDARILAARGLAQLPVNPIALHVLGYYEAAKGNEKRASIYVRLAANQSRRDTLSQLWLIEESVQKGDVREALVHYDLILRVSPEMRTTLYPVLMGALDDRNIRRAMTPYIHSDRDWVQAFLVHAIANSNNLPALVDLRIESGGLSDREAARQQDIDLLQRLMKDKQYQLAQRLYLRLPGAKADRLANPDFDALDRDGRFGPIGWQTISEADSGGGVTDDSNGRAILPVFASAGTTATVASRILFLTPGRYAFAARLSEVQAGQAGFLRWQLRCAKISGDTVAWTLDSTNSKPAALVTIPGDCLVQFLDVIASGGSGENGMQATIDSVVLRPQK